jgi:hypothetical protein
MRTVLTGHALFGVTVERIKRFLKALNPAAWVKIRVVRRVTFDRPLVIESPRIGFLNLLGSTAQSIVNEDKTALAPLFASSEESGFHVPICDVLMIYANLKSDGGVEGSPNGLREIIRESSASIVIVASENNDESFARASRKTGYGQANLALTVRRKGECFAAFYSRLFGKMFVGKSMPVAWVELAPQIPGETHPNSPEGYFIAEITHIVFK